MSVSLYENIVTRVKSARSIRHLPYALTKYSDNNNYLARLKQDGCLVLPDYIAPDKLKQMQEEVNNGFINNKYTTPCLGQNLLDSNQHKDLIDNYLLGTKEDYVKAGCTFDKDQVSSYQQALNDFAPSTLTLNNLATIPTFFKFCLDQKLLELISHYMTMIPTLNECYVRRNFAAKYKTMNHFWHRDLNHKYFILKMFVFFNDCHIENGPHEYVMGSHRNKNLLNNKPYYSDAEVDKAFPEAFSERKLSLVKAGTVIIEDTRGLHRARVPISGHRDVGYAVFTPNRHLCYSLDDSLKKGLSALQSYVISS